MLVKMVKFGDRQSIFVVVVGQETHAGVLQRRQVTSLTAMERWPAAPQREPPWTTKLCATASGGERDRLQLYPQLQFDFTSLSNLRTIVDLFQPDSNPFRDLASSNRPRAAPALLPLERSRDSRTGDASPHVGLNSAHPRLFASPKRPRRALRCASTFLNRDVRHRDGPRPGADA